MGHVWKKGQTLVSDEAHGEIEYDFHQLNFGPMEYLHYVDYESRRMLDHSFDEAWKKVESGELAGTFAHDRFRIMLSLLSDPDQKLMLINGDLRKKVKINANRS